MESGLSSLIFLGLLIAIFYFMLIRPQKKRVEAHRQLVESVSPGDEIITMTGIYGTVRSIGDENVEVEIAPGTTVRFLKSAIGRKVAEDLAQDRVDVTE
ncbi:MAG: preprotein translocase subunit YajC [Actinomycetota bacterium]|nr:preprotein translocase subunit YajC [Actinomycetota bacterium]